MDLAYHYYWRLICYLQRKSTHWGSRLLLFLLFFVRRVMCCKKKKQQQQIFSHILWTTLELGKLRHCGKSIVIPNIYICLGLLIIIFICFFLSLSLSLSLYLSLYICTPIKFYQSIHQSIETLSYIPILCIFLSLCPCKYIIYIYIYICVCVCVCVCVFWQHFFINTNFVEHNRHFPFSYFLVDPFILPY